MGQGLSCAAREDHRFFGAVQVGDLKSVKSALERDPSILQVLTVYDRHSALHVAAANGQIEILSLLLERSVKPDVTNRYKQTPLMLAAMHGKITCVAKLIEAGANILMFDSLRGRACLHYAAYYGHSDCVKLILSVAQSSPVAASWGYARFVNVRDCRGATPLHLAARQRQPECVHVLLDNGALVSASTGGYGSLGSTPLHLAARGGSLDCVRELMTRGADRLHRDSSGRTPYIVALKYKHRACAALLNPTAAEPLIWPSSLKFISELNGDAKALLEQALMEANQEREKKILKGTVYSLLSPTHSDSELDGSVSEGSDSELCCICFEQVCTVEVQDCGHQMCAQCTLALCCHNKPTSSTACLTSPVCPFCRSNINHLVVAKLENFDGSDQDVANMVYPESRGMRKSRNLSEGSSSFKGLAAIGSLGKIPGRGSGKMAPETVSIMKLDIQ